MKQIRICAALFCSLFLSSALTSCKQEGKEGAKSAEGTTELPAADLRAIRTQEGMTYTLMADYPMEGNGLLLRSVREWINESLGGTYDGSLADTAALADHYAGNMVAAAKGEGMTAEQLKDVVWESEVEFRRVYEDDSLLTYVCKKYLYMGGAHGSSATEGMTFRKSDGHRFGWNMLTHMGSELNDELKNGLKAYFKVKSDAELTDRLLLAETWRDASALPLPATTPWLEADGLHFIYQQYEIAAYAYGMPEVVIPLEKVRSLLNATILRCLPGQGTAPHGGETGFLRRVLHNLNGGCSSCSHG